MSAFGALKGLRDRPIEGVEAARELKWGFHLHPIELAGQGHNEPLVDARAYGVDGENYYFSERNPPYWQRVKGAIPDLLLRQAVAERLWRVNQRLHLSHLELHLFDGWRPRAVQAFFHDVWVPAEMVRRNPELSGDALTLEVERYWSPPTDDPRSPAPHATGAAVDLTLRWTDGDLLWMGSIFDDVTPLAHRDRFEAGDDRLLSFSDAEARANRRLLHWVMAEQGFVGDPDEWWHYSWGDQIWAKATGAPAAFYGLIEGTREAQPTTSPRSRDER
jgi:D-alanyl-D-alanine dipeptidase